MALIEKAVCPGCMVYVQEPFIKCVECKQIFCLDCFAKGYETQSHANNHAYEVVTLNFCIFESNWSAADEMSLLDSVAECGFGNWNDIASRLRSKTAEECQKHYIDNYINNPHQGLENVLGKTRREEPSNLYNMIPYEPSEEPPRPRQDCNITGELAGYMPCRADFNEEYDHFAELDVKDVCIDAEDTPLAEDLKVSAVEIYISRVKERCYRKRIIRDYGLINGKKSDLYDCNQPKIEKDLRDKMKVFAKLQTPEDHEKLMQSLLLECYLKQEIRELQHYRKAGLTLNDSVKLYQLCHQERMKYNSKSCMLNDISSLLEDKVACQSWLQKQALSQSSNLVPSPLPSLGRKPASRLDISGTPGVEKLNDDEKELCSTLRLLPHAYLNYKEILVKENKVLGSLRLSQARTLIKIDVNKTRKLFDFCVRQKFITKCDKA